MKTCIIGLASVSTFALDEAELRAAAKAEPIDRSGPWFEPKRWLGPRGFKYFSPATRFWLAAVSRALAAADVAIDEQTSDERGVVLGTNFAVHDILREMDRRFVSEGVAGVSPMHSPNFSINIPASVSAQKALLRGFCVTLTTPRVAGLQALQTGARALDTGRASCVVAGAAEVARDGQPRAAEGACALVLVPECRARARAVEPRAVLDASFDGLVERGDLRAPDERGWEAWWSEQRGRLFSNELAASGAALVLDLQVHGLSEATGALLRRSFVAAASSMGLRVEVSAAIHEGEGEGDGGALSSVIRCASWVARGRAACIVDVSARGQVCSVTVAPPLAGWASAGGER